MFLCFATIIIVALLHAFILVPILMAWFGPAAHVGNTSTHPESVATGEVAGVVRAKDSTQPRRSRKRSSVVDRVDQKFWIPHVGNVATTQTVIIPSGEATPEQMV